MKDELVSFETAKLAKEKGFDIRIGRQQMYSETGNLFQAIGAGYDMNICTIAPTQSLLQKWLREVHKIHILVVGSGDENKPYRPMWGKDLANMWLPPSGVMFNTHEEALEAGLQEALKLIKDEQR